MKRDFYYQDDHSNKFWSIELIENKYITTNGRIGAKPRQMEKVFPTYNEAQKQADRQIASKLKKGYIEGIAPAYVRPNWSTFSMSNEIFWRIIGLFNWKKTGDDDAVIEPAVRALSEMSINDIRQFEDILAMKLYALDTKQHAIASGVYQSDKYFSPDDFLYTRCVVVANGSELYEAVLKDPTAIPKEIDFEPILSIGSSAYERKTGEDFDYSSPLSYESCSNQDGWAY